MRHSGTVDSRLTTVLMGQEPRGAQVGSSFIVDYIDQEVNFVLTQRQHLTSLIAVFVWG